MYTEGFESLEEAERESHRTYGTSADMDRLMRENDKLKKSLEKEKFFNKLLDQEIQELKTSMPNGQGTYQSDYWSGKKSVSRGAFYTLLITTLALGAYIVYGMYYDKKFNYLNTGRNSSSISNLPSNSTGQPKTATPVMPADAPSQHGNAPAAARVIPPVIKDSVPNIIGAKKVPAQAKSDKQEAAITPDEEYNEEEVKATLEEDAKPLKRNVTKPVVTPTASTGTVAASTTPPPATQTRQVIGRYRITSKANFYNSPDENTMRSTFISESANKVVGALEDKNGFIFVEYTNDLGFTSKGWLSKKDLTKE